jgi:hypothetical protein
MHKIWRAALGREVPKIAPGGLVTGPETTWANPGESFRPAEPTGKLGFSLDEKIKLETDEDMFAVRALIHVLQDEPDKARSLIRSMSSRDRAVLSFELTELSRLVSEEEDFRTMEDRRKARLAHPDHAYPDMYDT